jgi:hypothetical protein
MPGLVPGIHVFVAESGKTWMAGTSPAMTTRECMHGDRTALRGSDEFLQ